jgi:hypothetical protein
MLAPLRSSRVLLHRAILASVLLHGLVAAFLALAVRSRAPTAPGSSRIDTGVDVVVRAFDLGPSLDGRPLDPAPPSAAIAPEPSAPDSRTAQPVEIGDTPHAWVPPQSLSAETLAIIARSVTSHSVAGSTISAHLLHAAMRPGQSIVYVLDCSGSMGEHGKLALARAALIATLRAQSENVRFQVIVYDGAARPLIPGTSCVPATSANIEVAVSKLALQLARGRSNHAEALLAAIRFNPDAILILTDIDGLNRDQSRALLAQLGKSTYIGLSKVSAAGVEQSREIRLRD